MNACGRPRRPQARRAPGAAGWVDLDVLLDDLEDRLARIETLCAVAPGSDPGSARDSSAGIATAVPPSHDVAGPSGRFRGSPVAVAPIPLPRRPG